MKIPQIFLSVHSFVSLKINVSFLFLRSHYQKFESQYVTNTTRHSNEIIAGPSSRYVRDVTDKASRPGQHCSRHFFLFVFELVSRQRSKETKCYQ